MGNREEIDPSTQSKGTGQRTAKHQWPQMSLPRRQVQLAAGASLLGWEVAGGWEVCPGIGSSRIILSPFPLPRTISNFQPVGGLRDQFSSQKLPTPPACLFLAWMTDWYFWGERSHMLTLRSPPPSSKSVRKCQGIHSFFHICTQAQASLFQGLGFKSFWNSLLLCYNVERIILKEIHWFITRWLFFGRATSLAGS